MTQEVKLSYDQTFEKYRPKGGNWWDAAPFMIGLIGGIVDGRELPPRERIARVQYVLARFHKLLEEEAREWKL